MNAPRNPEISMARLSEAMLRKRMDPPRSVYDTADEAGINASTYSRLERGDGYPDLNTYFKFCHWLGADSGDFLTRPRWWGPPTPAPAAVTRQDVLTALRTDSLLPESTRSALVLVIEQAYALARLQPLSVS